MAPPNPTRSPDRRLRTIAALGALMVQNGCTRPRPADPGDLEANFTLILSVATPAGDRTAASPVRVTREVAPVHWCGWMCPGADRTSYRGEAPMVDLPDGRKLLVLFTRTPTGIGPPEWLANSEAIRAELTTGQAPQRSADRDADGDGMADLPFFSPVPYLVTFRDPRDPASIVQVDPLDLAATFGRGYRLRRVMLKPLAADPFSLGTGEQPVGLDPPSRVLAALPWLRSFRQAPITRPDGSTPFPDDLDRSSFIEP